MNREIIKYLRNISTNERRANSLIVSSFLFSRGINSVNNRLISQYLIPIESRRWHQVVVFNKLLQKHRIDFSLEFLIELFEFVISPKDKVINGAVYTPKNIREYIVDEILAKYQGDLMNVRACDFSVGCGGFLYSLCEKLHSKTKKTFFSIFKDNLFGLDVTSYSIERTKIFLSLLAVLSGEDRHHFEFNLERGNALDYDWKAQSKVVLANKGFDVVLGNPPYVCSRNIHKSSLKLLHRWSVASSGHPDLYIPFFQIGYENLADGGLLGYITVNTFFKSINGRALREYFGTNQVPLQILNFGGEQVFNNRNTYTCLCFAKKQVGPGNVDYLLTNTGNLRPSSTMTFTSYQYDSFDHGDGWNLVNSIKDGSFVRGVEATGDKFKDLFETRNGIATLKNNVYKFTPSKENTRFYYFTSHDGVLQKIEKKVCRPIVNSNCLKNEADLVLNREQIIFPYKLKKGKAYLIPSKEMRKRFPNTWTYLLTKRKVLATRDKGKAKTEYEAWYAYGRRQSLEIQSHKLFFPHICHRPKFVLSSDKDLLFYNGVAVVSENKEELLVLKRILESDIFYQYVKKTAKSYASDFISLSRNYIKNFGIPKLSVAQKKTLLAIKDPVDLNAFVSNFYKDFNDRNKTDDPTELKAA